MKSSRLMLLALFALFTASAANADPLKCDVSGYKGLSGLSAVAEQDVVTISWSGQGGAELRARYAIDGGQPVVRELAVKKSGGQWSVLGQNLTPEYRVVTGVRRMTEQQAQPLRAAGVELTPEVIEKNRWHGFWDAPLVMPPAPEAANAEGRNRPPAPPRAPRVLDGPRKPEEVRRAAASFQSTSCSVKTDGASLAVTFPEPGAPLAVETLARGALGPADKVRSVGPEAPRSEEHTSELQSRFDLVCRLLLEIGRASCRERV